MLQRGGIDRAEALGQRLNSAPMVAPEEKRLAGAVNAVLFLLGGITLASLLLLPGITHAHYVTLLAVAGGVVLWGALSLLVIDWRRVPSWIFPLATVSGLIVIAIAVASSGGVESPAWTYLFFAALFAAYFYPPPLAIALIAGCAVVDALPLLYDSRATHNAFAGQLIIASAAFFGLGGAILAGKRLMWRLRVRAEELANEQGALRRVATAVVGSESAERIYHLVAEESARLLGCGSAGILRVESEVRAVVMGSWADQEGGTYEPGTAIEIVPEGTVGRAIATKQPVRIEHHSSSSGIGLMGYSSSIVTPVYVAGSTWGVIVVASAGTLTARDEQRLVEFGDLLATAIVSIEDRAKLADQAASDPLTEVANHRTLQQRLAAEMARALRHDTLLSVAVLDIDHFKQLNDSGGHDTGDEMLVRVARCLKKLARSEDTLGRVGGDEFAWILPDTSREQALVAVERARRVITMAVPEPYRVTISAGICDSSVTEDPAQLIRLADGALYWSKAHGRDQCWVYDPEVVAELSAQERAERLERSQALLGLRALARAIDAKDPATREHSERVAALVGKLSRTLGWSPERSLLLSESALVHDVGKIGIPDELLRKPDPLTPQERAQITDHAELSARIVEGVLAPEQVEWIRTHHERPDGDGYPDGLTHIEISEGAALLSLADAFDVMTISRPYSVPKTIEEAISECESLIGRQFTRSAVGALIQLSEAGELGNREPIRPAFAGR